VCNYDKAKRQQMKAEIESLMGNQLLAVEFVRDEKGLLPVPHERLVQRLRVRLQGRSLTKFSNEEERADLQIEYLP
jgi:hypothetical protein